MKILLAVRSALAAAVLALPAAGLAQTNPSPPNLCLKPVPREGKGYDRFLEINKQVQANEGKAEVIFVGDSITEGWGGNGKQVWAKYYAPRQALNLGIGSDHTQHVLWRLDHGNLDGLKPKAAVVLIGVNNIPDDNNPPRYVLEGVTAVVRKLREKLPDTKVLLLGIFPFREDFCAQRGKALQVNQALRKLDDGQNVRFLDIGHLFIAFETDQGCDVGTLAKVLSHGIIQQQSVGKKLKVGAGMIFENLCQPRVEQGFAAKYSKKPGTAGIAVPDDFMDHGKLNVPDAVVL